MVYPVPPPPGTHTLLEDVCARVSAPPSCAAGTSETRGPSLISRLTPLYSRRPRFLFPSSGGEDCTQAGESQGTQTIQNKEAEWAPGEPGLPMAGVLVAL